MTNGERIKFLREKNGYTQKDIATKLGVEPAAISKYELDMREPNIEALKKLASIFNVSIDYLLGRTTDIFANEIDKDILDLSMLKRLYNNRKIKIDKLKDVYTNKNATSIACNELCAGTGQTLYGETKINNNISMVEIESMLDDIENSKDAKPQIMIKLKSLKNSIIIVEIDSCEDDEMPLTATHRVNLYTSKLSRKYNVLGLAMSIDKDEVCKIVDSIYQKNKDPYYKQLYLPKTVLTVDEYIDIMRRL